MSNVIDEGVFEFDEDISGAELPPPLPNGIYAAEIRQVVAQNSKSSDNVLWVTDIVIPTSEYPPDFPEEEEPDGVTLRMYTVVGRQDGPALTRQKVNARRHCEACGVTPSSKINLTDFMGKNVRVEVEGEVFDGEMRARARRILPAK